MRRRDFITALGGVAVAQTAWPRPLGAQQQARVPMIGYLSGRSPQSEAPWLAGLRRGLGEAGFVENLSATFEFRFSEGRDDRLSDLAADLAGRKVAVLVATSYPSAMAAKKATSTIPIVFASGLDPVRGGLVASFNRPGGNATGAAFSQQSSGRNDWRFCEGCAQCQPDRICD